MQIQRVATAHAVDDNGLMYMDRTLGQAGRAAGEAQQRHVFGLGVGQATAVGAVGQGRGERQGALGEIVIAGVGQQDVLQARKLAPPRRDFASIVGRGRHQHPCVADR